MGAIQLKQALDELMAVYVRSKNYADRTREEYQNDLEDLVSFLERKGISGVKSLSLNAVDYYLAELDSRGLAGSTRKRKMVAVRMFLAYLFREGYLSNDISQRLIIPFADQPIPRVLSQSEYQRLVRSCDGNIRDTAIIEAFLQTGIKLSELVGLTVDDIDLPSAQESEGEMRIRAGAGRKGRVIPLNSKVCEAIAAYLITRPAVPCSALFINRFGDPMGDRGVQKLVDRLLIQAEIKGASVQTLRHTFAVHHLAKGAKLETLQKILGHQDIRSTETYVTLSNELTRRELEDHAL